MAVRTKEELLDLIKGRIGEDTGDDALTLIEDISDTYDDLETKSKDPENWHEKYDQLDADWRRRYKERFYNNEADESEDHQDPPEVRSFADLFTTE